MSIDLFPGVAQLPDWVAEVALIVGIPLLAAVAVWLFLQAVDPEKKWRK